MGTKRFIPKFIAIGLFFLLLSTHAFAARAHKLIVFQSPACQRCQEAKNKVMPDIEKEFRGLFEIEYSDITNIENYKFLLRLKEQYKSNVEIVLPLFFMEGRFLNGKADLKNELRPFILASLDKRVGEAALPEIDLVARFRDFEPLAVASAGLIDGINPCAFTVIVFFISFLVLQGYRERELIAIGLAFISAVFLTYLLIGLGIFSFLYSLKGFWLVTRIANFTIGVFSIILGALAVYDLVKFKRTKSTEGLLLQLPKVVKARIHSVIGLHYRKPKEEQAQSVAPPIFILLISALVTGFLVSILELVCTGQVYLPTISFVLKTSPLKLEAWGYLLFYNLMFIVPLLIIFLFALLGTSSEQFAKFLKKYLALTKIWLAILFFTLGIFLIWRA